MRKTIRAKVIRNRHFYVVLPYEKNKSSLLLIDAVRKMYGDALKSAHTTVRNVDYRESKTYGQLRPTLLYSGE